MITYVLISLFLCASFGSASASEIVNCSYKGINLWGKVKVVESFADIDVKVVSSFPDIRVQKVNSFASDCGEWQFVDSFPDFTIRYVNSFEDISVKFVPSFPGTK